MVGLELLAAVSATLVGYGAVELAVHRRRLLRIPVRVHVNGTRGKSSVTRLIAAGLRHAGRVTCAKTTGTLARMILPDGRELPIFRPAGPNIIEQKRIVSVAAAYDAEALVIECMALQPELQALSELQLVRATHAVITNCRPDHLDVMGPGEPDVARALAGVVPPRGKLFTSETRHLGLLADATADRGCALVAVGADEVASIGESELARFAYTEHAENVALALAVLADLGVAREVALAGMQAARPDPGAMIEHRLDFFGRRIAFVNGFAANDPVSTRRLWQDALARHADVERRVAVFNCRADRVDRSLQLGRELTSWPAADAVLLMGSGCHVFARAALRAGLDPACLQLVEHLRVDEIFERIVAACGRSALVMGMGNIGGQGLDLVRFFANRAQVA
jgi:poly-gamma-glutamate synthase PgsB/CapB